MLSRSWVELKDEHSSTNRKVNESAIMLEQYKLAYEAAKREHKAQAERQDRLYKAIGFLMTQGVGKQLFDELIQRCASRQDGEIGYVNPNDILDYINGASKNI